MADTIFADDTELGELALSISLEATDPEAIRAQVDIVAAKLLGMAQEQAQQPFLIDSEDRANWLLRKLGNIDAERERITAQYEAQIAELDRREKSLRDHFLPQLEIWAREQVATLKKRSITLLHGTLAFRKVSASETVEVEEKETAEAEARARGFVKDVLPPVDMTGYRKAALAALKADGELWPGLLYKTTPERDSFRIDFPVPGTERSR